MFEMSFFSDLAVVLTIDLAVLTLCTILLLRYGRLAHSHPAITYLFFHALIVTSRLIAIVAGADLLFSDLPWIWEAVTEEEIGRAVMLADLTLIAMTVAWIRASLGDARQVNRLPESTMRVATPLSLAHIWRVAAIAFPIGIVGLVLLGSIPGFAKINLDLGEWQDSNWLTITITWAGLALLALIYWYGFRWWLLAPMTVYLLIIALQGSSRVRFIIPLILMLQILLDRRGQKWPSPVVSTVIVAAALLFFPMKSIGRMAQEGATFNEITAVSSDSIRTAMAGQHGDQEILDQYASALTLIERSGKFYYGSTYLTIFTLPVPRQWWPDKPGVADYLKDFSTPQRPMAEMGMVMTFIGEFYLNFGYIGIFALAYFMAYGLARTYFRAYRSSYFSVYRFGYLLISCNLIQVYRDGLMSLLLFTFVNMMPLVLIVLLHYVWRPRARDERARLASAQS